MPSTSKNKTPSSKPFRRTSTSTSTNTNTNTDVPVSSPADDPPPEYEESSLSSTTASRHPITINSPPTLSPTATQTQTSVSASTSTSTSSSFPTLPIFGSVSAVSLPGSFSRTLLSSGSPYGSPDPDPIPGLSPLPARPGAYTPPNSTLSPDRSTLSVTDPSLVRNPARLVEFVRQQALLPPVPEVRVRGTVFDVRVNLLRYFVPEIGSGVRGTGTVSASVGTGTGTGIGMGTGMAEMGMPVAGTGTGTGMGTGTGKEGSARAGATTTASLGATTTTWNYLTLTPETIPREALQRAGGREGATLESVARVFCKDHGVDRAFVLTRTISNWDQEYIVGSIRNLLAELGYVGKLDISFPLAHQRVVISPQTTLLDKFVAIFNKPRTYEAVQAVWPYASAPPPNGSESGSTHAARAFAVRSERAWWNDWKLAIERAILSRRKGIVGLDDLLEIRLGYPGPARPGGTWGESA